jgi:hypothetical protein
MMEGMYGELDPAFERLWSRYRTRFPALFDEGMRARAAGLEGALSLPPDSIARYAWFSELGTVGPALMLATAGTVQFDAVRSRSIGGCTSFVARDGDTTVHARNVDYWGMGFWQTHATLIAVDPRHADGSPDGLRYLQVSDLGELWAGTTGVNDAGLVVTTHLHVSRDVAALDGRLTLSPLQLFATFTFTKQRTEWSVYRVVETLLRRSHGVADATRLFDTVRPVGSWSFIVSDPSGARAVIDATPREVRVHRDEPVATNTYFDPQMAARELVPSRGPTEGSRLRLQRARALAAEHPEDMTVPRAVSILRDRYDLATNSVRAVSPNTVLSPDATQSVVIRARPNASPELWVAHPHNGELVRHSAHFPSALATFLRLDWQPLFDASRPIRFSMDDLVRYDPHPLDTETAVYLHAMALQRDQHNPRDAAEVLSSIVTNDPAVPLMAAWLWASLGQYDRASLQVDRARPAPELARHGSGEHIDLAPNQELLRRLLEADLARIAGDAPAAREGYTAARSLAVAEAAEGMELNAPMIALLNARLAHPRRTIRFPAPDLKFQDVLALYAR